MVITCYYFVLSASARASSPLAVSTRSGIRRDWPPWRHVAVATVFYSIFFYSTVKVHLAIQASLQALHLNPKKQIIQINIT